MTRRALPLVATCIFVAVVGAVLANAGSTLGYDFDAYREAALRLIHGLPLYDAAADVAGPHGLFLYPPPFALAMVPFALLPTALATWLWTGLMTVALVAAIALMPVRRDVRWLTLLLAGLDWPAVYSIKLGQVGPLLVLGFVVAWRWLERPAVVGVVGALGALVKVQPGLLLVWAALTRRWRAVVVGAVAIVVAVLLSAAVVGLSTWSDYVGLLARVSTPVTTPHLVTPGAIAVGLGAPEFVATVFQWAIVALTACAFLFATLRGRPAQGIVVAAVASQLLSPVLWDHYAIVLLIPTAYLLEERVWTASLIPLATSVPLVGITPPLAYPLLFVVSIGAVMLAPLPVGTRSSEPRPEPVLSSRP